MTVTIYPIKAIYCHENGEYEGIVGYSFRKDGVEARAKETAELLMADRGLAYEESRLRFDIQTLYHEMTEDERQSVIDDWMCYPDRGIEVAEKHASKKSATGN